jgi:hypothetical protein
MDRPDGKWMVRIDKDLLEKPVETLVMLSLDSGTMVGMFLDKA